MNPGEAVNITFYNHQIFIDGRQLDFCDSFIQKDFRIKSVERSPTWGWIAAYPEKGQGVHR